MRVSDGSPCWWCPGTRPAGRSSDRRGRAPPANAEDHRLGALELEACLGLDVPVDLYTQESRVAADAHARSGLTERVSATLRSSASCCAFMRPASASRASTVAGSGGACLSSAAAGRRRALRRPRAVDVVGNAQADGMPLLSNDARDGGSRRSARLRSGRSPRIGRSNGWPAPPLPYFTRAAGSCVSGKLKDVTGRSCSAAAMSCAWFRADAAPASARTNKQARSPARRHRAAKAPAPLSRPAPSCAHRPAHFSQARASIGKPVLFECRNNRTRQSAWKSGGLLRDFLPEIGGVGGGVGIHGRVAVLAGEARA